MKSFYFLFAVFFFFSCNNKPAKQKADQVPGHLTLMLADKAFSDMCKEVGMKKAFIEYIDSNGVLLRPGHVPIVGANAIDFLIQQDDSGYSLSWEPQHAEIAVSGEMGFTYGIYTMKPKAKDTTIYGTYTSIWRKQKDGKWKLLLDSGNEGLDLP